MSQLTPLELWRLWLAINDSRAQLRRLERQLDHALTDCQGAHYVVQAHGRSWDLRVSGQPPQLFCEPR